MDSLIPYRHRLTYFMKGNNAFPASRCPRNRVTACAHKERKLYRPTLKDVNCSKIRTKRYQWKWLKIRNEAKMFFRKKWKFVAVSFNKIE